MGTVTGVIRDTQGNAVAGAIVTVRYTKPVIGYQGGAAASNLRVFTANGSGEVTMAGLVPGVYAVTVSVPSTSQAVLPLELRETTGTVLSADPQTFQSFLDTDAGNITPSILQQAAAAAAAAAASATEAATFTPWLSVDNWNVEETAGGTLEFYRNDTKVMDLTPSGDLAVTGGMTADTPSAGDPDTRVATKAYVDAAMPAGSVIWYAANTPPAGYLKANGALVSRTTYADLFAAIGTTYGVGDGSTTFALPDLRGEFIRGWDDGRSIDTGRTFGSAQADAFRAHSHDITGTTNNINNTPGSHFYNTNQFNTTSTTSTASTPAGGTETRPRNVALLACIKF